MIEISLTQGKVALIDDEDLEIIEGYKWYCRKTHHNYYAVAHKYIERKRTSIQMHREILKCTFKEYQVDHIDGNGLNNCKSNLRIVTPQQNSFNRKYTFGTSMYKGVSWNKRDDFWQATIKYNGKSKMLGYFKDEMDAAKAYNEAAKELFGEFAALNEVI